MNCHCGGIEGRHTVGEPDCLREPVDVPPICIDQVGDQWIMPNGHIITGYTLREQRGYYHHGNNEWSRPKDHKSINSLPDGT